MKFSHILSRKLISEPKSSCMFILLKSLNLNLNHLKHFKYLLYTSNIPIQFKSYQYYNFLKYIRKRINHYPIQYILGEWYFGDLIVKCKPDVLIPRVETYGIIQITIELLYSKIKRNEQINFLEIGIGTGIIFISLILKYPKFRCLGIDINHKCIELSRLNAEKYKISNYELIHTDFRDLNADQKFDFIISNPPYIYEGCEVMKDLSYESKDALFSGSKGIDMIKEIIINSRKYVKKEGFVVLEISPEQETIIFDLLIENKFNNFLFKDDIFGKKRFLVFFI